MRTAMDGASTREELIANLREFNPVFKWRIDEWEKEPNEETTAILLNQLATEAQLLLEFRQHIFRLTPPSWAKPRVKYESPEEWNATTIGKEFPVPVPAR